MLPEANSITLEETGRARIAEFVAGGFLHGNPPAFPAFIMVSEAERKTADTVNPDKDILEPVEGSMAAQSHEDNGESDDEPDPEGDGVI